MSRNNAWRFSEIVTDEYFKDVPMTKKNACIQQIEALSLVRGLTWITLRTVIILDYTSSGLRTLIPAIVNLSFKYE